MIFRRVSQLMTAVALAVAFVAFAGVAGGSEAKAQGFYRNYYHNRNRQWEREAFRRQQQRERYFWLRQRQRERWEWRRHNRFDRYRYSNRYGRYPYFRRW